MAQDAGVRSISDLRQFGQNLQVASNALTTLFQQLNTMMHNACDTWNDNKAQAFMEEFEHRKNDIEKMSEDMNTFSQYIGRVCEKLEDYQHLR